MRNLFATLFEGLGLPVRGGASALNAGYPDDLPRRDVDVPDKESPQSDVANRPGVDVEHDERQQLDYWRLWRLIRPGHALGIPPALLDPSVPEHVTLALTVVGDYDAAREQPGAFGACLYRPVSQLPYPSGSIRRCCEFLIGIADGEPGSSAGDRELLAPERDALGVALFSLDYFLDVPASEIPREKLENLAYGHAKQNLTASMPAAKPSAGEVVIRHGSGDTDYVSEVIGVGDNEEWIVLTSSGSSMQVVRSAESGKWDEVNVIAPAEASWLTLTPPGGTPTWES
jgi:hypothetical protein